MRFATIVLSLSLAAVGPLVVAQPHRHVHRHFVDKREADMEVVNLPGPTVITYVLDGKPISEDEVKRGLENGTLRLVEDGGIETGPEPSQEEDKSEDVVVPDINIQKQEDSESTNDEASSVDTAAPAATSPAEEANPPSEYDSSSSSGGNGEGVDSDFPDGQLSCDTFPEAYGAIPVNWENLGGWAGLQKVTYNDDRSAIVHIVTMKSGPCDEDMMCSYACPPGYLKAQWPAAQGASGESVGGIECRNGKLHLPRAAESSKLCVRGAGGVKVENKVGKAVAVCRTDYPGTESMNIPATMNPESSEPYDLSCPDGSQYYEWDGKATSAQYYVNKAGVSLEEGCTWSSSGSDKGNWAPVNLGVGKNDGTWLSIQANAPTNPSGKLDFRIEIQGGDLGGSCRYEDGTYYQNGQANSKGCTVKVNSGDATFVFS